MFEASSAYGPLLVILLFFVAGVIYMDLRSRRCWGLALLALALSCYGAWLVYFLLALQDAPQTGDDLAVGLIWAIFVAIFLLCTLIVLIGALVEAGVARHWWWLASLVVVALVPTLLTLATVTLRLRLGGPGFSFISFILFLAPDLAMLAYGIARIVRPVPLLVV